MNDGGTKRQAFAFSMALTVSMSAAVAQEEADPDMASAVILPVERTVLPLERVIIPVEGLALGTAAAVSPLQARAEALAEQSGTIRASVTEDEVRLSITGDVLFAFDSDAIGSEGAVVLGELAEFLVDGDVASVLVEGHTDSIGSAVYNLDLSNRRALSVIAWLQDRGGLEQIDFTHEGYGFEFPVAENGNADGSDNPEGRALNRRVEFVIDDG